LWGLGHTLTILAVGAPIVVFNWVVTPRLGLAMELAVGVMLIGLGLRNIRSHGRESARASHAHDHDDLGPLDRICGGLGVYQAARPLIVGVVHGLAGSAAIALLVLTTIRNPWWALGYLVVFGVGTVAGMVLITTAIAVPFVGRERSDTTHRRLRLATGVLSVTFGLFLTYEVAVVNGLFSAVPHWTPQ
jgi:hypothetical protein